MLGFAAVRVALLMDASSVLNGCAVFVPKHALALAHASGGGKCKRRVPYPECNGGRRRRSAQAHRGRLGCLLRAPEAEPLSRLVFLVVREAREFCCIWEGPASVEQKKDLSKPPNQRCQQSSENPSNKLECDPTQSECLFHRAHAPAACGEIAARD